MKKLFLALATILTLTFANASHAFASTNDFYFSSATFDYYLEKTEDGASRMRVEEVLTAVFPDFNQNHGIERCLPTHYRGVESLVTSSFNVTRNGTKEPFSTNTNQGELCYRIGSASSYVHGEQTYKITYDLKNVILQPENATNQELYWDTNGTGWSQKFNSLTATVHLSEPLKNAFSGNTSCYVGKSGAKGTERCETLVSNDKTEIAFSAKNLAARENLTLDLEFSTDTFTIAKPKPNYLIFFLLGVLALLWVLSIIFWLKYYHSVDEKRALAKNTSKPVQYTPPKDFTVAEAGQLWLSSHPNLQVATLMELAVGHKVELERGEKKTFGGYKWKIHVKNLDGVSTEQAIVLEILNGGSSVKVGDTIDVKTHTATSHLESLGKQYTSKPESSLRSRGFLESKKHKSKGSGAVGLLIFFYILTAIGTIMYIVNFSPRNDLTYDLNFIAVGIAFCSCFIYTIIACAIFSKVGKYNKITQKGIEISNYLDGLQEYMCLAEKDRIKFLHSVKTADVSNQGIVKLWEKLLPYAILFKIEDSWLDELNKYYQMDDIDNPYWLHGAAYFAISDFRSFNNYTRSVVSSSTAIESSSSSGFSGGGGGGFSGGGGGGGGGGGW